MTAISDWIEHRMSVLEIAGPAVLAEHADLSEATLVELFQSNRLSALQQSQRRRLAWALQVNLKRLNALEDGEIEWIDDADRYLPFSFEPAGALDRPCGVREEHRPGIAGRHELPQGTPVLGRVGWCGRIESDDCWDEQWGRRLTDHQPQRRDTYALETCRAGHFIVVRNAGSWQATAGAWVAVYLCNDSDGVGYFGHLIRCAPGAWALLPGLPGHADDAGLMTIEPERALRIGRLVRQWPAEGTMRT